jgi:hypothetical protein
VNDPDRKIRRQVERYLATELKDEKLADKLAAQTNYPERGKCDFCGIPDIALRKDFETEIPDGGMNRFALVCDACHS